MLFLATFLMVVRRPRSSRRTRRSRAPSRRMISAIHGKEYRPRADPPAIVQQPWGNIVVTTTLNIETGPTEEQVTIKTIGDCLWAQLAATQNPNCEFKICRCAIWQTSGLFFGVTFRDLQRQDSNQNEATIEDTSAKNHYARVGFVWSAADQSIPYRSTSETSAGKPVLTVKTPSGASYYVIHFQLKWRLVALAPPGRKKNQAELIIQTSPQSVPPPSVEEKLDELCYLLKHRL